MKNKKGDLLNNVLTTVIAIIGIALLIYGAWKLYSVYLSSDELNAKAAINTLDGRIGATQVGQTAEFSVAGIDKWIIVAWNINNPGRPEKCYSKNCICICKFPEKTIGSISAWQYAWNFNKYCQDSGLCRFYDEKVSVYTVFDTKTLNVLTDYTADFIKEPNLLGNSKGVGLSLEGYGTVLMGGRLYTSKNPLFNKLEPLPYIDSASFDNTKLNELFAYKTKDEIRLVAVSQRPIIKIFS
jgi:hypothetical protein